MWAATSRTVAPASRAAAASATPCLPEERLPRNRTGSRGSRVPPALMVTVRPASGKSGSSAGAMPGTASLETVGQGHGRFEDGLGFGQAAGAGVLPVSRPLAGSSTVTPRLRSVSTLAWVAGVLPHFGVHGRGEEHGAARPSAACW